MLLVTALNVPAVVPIVTVPPLTTIATLLASLNETVIVDVAVPLASIVVGLAAMVELVVLGIGAVKIIEAVFVLLAPAFTVNETTAVVTVVLL